MPTMETHRAQAVRYNQRCPNLDDLWEVGGLKRRHDRASVSASGSAMLLWLGTVAGAAGAGAAAVVCGSDLLQQRHRPRDIHLLTRRARITIGTATQYTHINDSPDPRPAASVSRATDRRTARRPHRRQPWRGRCCNGSGAEACPAVSALDIS
jgi:hypothetical protein